MGNVGNIGRNQIKGLSLPWLPYQYIKETRIMQIPSPQFLSNCEAKEKQNMNRSGVQQTLPVPLCTQSQMSTFYFSVHKIHN